MCRLFLLTKNRYRPSHNAPTVATTVSKPTLDYKANFHYCHWDESTIFQTQPRYKRLENASKRRQILTSTWTGFDQRPLKKPKGTIGER